MSPPPEVTPGLEGLQALAHPVRVRMLGLLRTEGPATATGLASRLGLNSGATSYHLRQLARHGFVVDVEGRGNGRERWWEAAHRSTRTAEIDDSQAAREVTDAYAQAVAVVYAEQVQRAVEEAAVLPSAWRKASTLSDWQLRVSPDRARALIDAL